MSTHLYSSYVILKKLLVAISSYFPIRIYLYHNMSIFKKWCAVNFGCFRDSLCFSGLFNMCYNFLDEVYSSCYYESWMRGWVITWFNMYNNFLDKVYSNEVYVEVYDILMHGWAIDCKRFRESKFNRKYPWVFSFIWSFLPYGFVCIVMKVLWDQFISTMFCINYSLIFSVVSVILPMICALLAVGFYTLLERKVLGYIQNRKGPNKVSFMGILQPFSDAGKLFTKEYVIPTYSNKFVFFFSPFLVLLVSLLLWMLFPNKYSYLILTCGLLQFLALSSFSVYGVMLAGWSSNSKYALLGSVRAIAQSISYEIPMTFSLLSLVFCIQSFMTSEFLEFQEFMLMFGVFNMISLVIWLICMLAETNRAPFDFVEGESELVSGFNVEYSSSGFAMLFMAEYSAMLFNSIFVSVVFFGGSHSFMMLISCFFIFMFLWVRGTLPRMRYDKMMHMCWTTLLIFSMMICLIYVFILFLL